MHPRDRFDYWHSVACREIVEHESVPVSRAHFEAEIEVGSMGTLDLIAFQNSPLRVEHGQAHTRRSPEQLFLCRETSGSMSVEQDGRQITLHPGDMTLLDPALPYSANFSPGSKTLVLKLPRRELQARLGKTRSMVARLIELDSAEDSLTSSFNAALPALVGEMRPVCEQLVANFMLDLIALSLAKAIKGTTPRISSSKAMAILQIRAAVKARLADPDLDVQSIADAVGLSVRYANDILAWQDTSIGRLILTERLERCRQALGDPAQSCRSVSEVAFGWGFSDLTHFGRCFKKAYGMSPRDYQISHR
ncbi:helix-turn-helix domain-containing protein [Frankia sp. RB7]|nr:helix-turn-helix domain-containing protein [Frankia sp. RB7]